jgi:outer membrane receptor protein involved in Fe transport
MSVPMTAGDLDFVVNYSHSGDYSSIADNGLGQIAPSQPGEQSPGRVTTSSTPRLLVLEGEDWSVRLWGKNLSDEEYVSFANETGTITKKTPAPPLTYGSRSHATSDTIPPEVDA